MKRLLAILLALLVSASSLALPVTYTASSADDRITTGLPNEDNISFTIWVREEGTNSAVGQYMVSTLDSGNLAILKFSLTATTLTTRLGSSVGETVGTALVTATWTFYAVTRSGASYKLYINGSTTADMTNSSVEAAGAITQVVLGNRDISATTPWCGCTIAALKFWNAVLTPQQLQNEMYSYRPKTTESLYGWWPMVAGLESGDLLDRSGNANNWTDSGSAYSTTGPPISW